MKTQVVRGSDLRIGMLVVGAMTSFGASSLPVPVKLTELVQKDPTMMPPGAIQGELPHFFTGRKMISRGEMFLGMSDKDEFHPINSDDYIVTTPEDFDIAIGTLQAAKQGHLSHALRLAASSALSNNDGHDEWPRDQFATLAIQFAVDCDLSTKDGQDTEGQAVTD